MRIRATPVGSKSTNWTRPEIDSMARENQSDAQATGDAPPDYGLTGCEKQGLYRAIHSRRDVRSHFIPCAKIPADALARILNAAHHAPSVGFSQPWNFILIRDISTRTQVKESFLREREKSVKKLDGDPRQEKYKSLKLEGITESDVNVCVTYDPTRFGPFVLGRTSIEETGVYSVCCAVQNLWLSARAEGIGVGWVSIIDNEEIGQILGLPAHIRPIAYLCLGYVAKFEEKPDLEKAGWLPRMTLADVVCYEKWDSHDSDNWRDLCSLVEKVREHSEKQGREDNI